MSAPTVRAAVTADAPAIAAIVAREVRDGVAHFGETPPTVEEVAADIAATGARPYLVADEGGVPVGFAKASAWKPREAYAWTVEVGVYLAPAAQGRGIGRALVTALLDALRERGFRTVLAGIALPNPASQGLFEALGFSPVGIVARNGYKHGAWRDVGYWQLHLGDGPPGAPPHSPSTSSSQGSGPVSQS